MANTSSAVMAQRKAPLASNDYYPTPPHVIRALFEFILVGRIINNIFEPACGAGDMSKALKEYALGKVISSDIRDYGYEDGSVANYLADTYKGSDNPCEDWVVTNPPFKFALEFALKAIKDIVGPDKKGSGGVAMFVRLQWLEGQKRYYDIFKPYPPSIIAVFSERVPITAGKLDPKTNSAVAYAWVIWFPGVTVDTITKWVPPKSKEWTKPGDYPDTNTVIHFNSEFLDIEEMISNED